MALVSAAATLTACCVGNLGVWHGQPVVDGQYPFLTALLRTATYGDAAPEQFCAGSLVHASAVLTAAHCVAEYANASAPPFVLSLNASDYTAPVHGGRVQRRPLSIHVLPGFNQSVSIDLDVALVILDRPVPASIAPVPMITSATAALEGGGTAVVVAGWGQSSASLVNTRANYANLTAVTLDRCAALFPPPEWCCPWPKLSPNMLCTYDFSGRNASDCDGDSGGPLLARGGASGVSDSGAANVLVGTVSWGTLCGGPPDVFQRVLRWRPWIEGVLHGLP